MTFQLKSYCTFLCAACLGLILTTGCNNAPKTPEPEEQVDYYGTGEIQRRFTHIGGKKEGKMTDFYPDGKIKGERLFKNDKQIGKTTLFFPSGQVKEVQYYVDGFKEGGDTLWYENRQPQFVMDYKAGKRHGYLRKWSPEGELIYEARFEMDSLVEVKGEKVK
jgi:antitoxin component YwqK of YwqJK toxin-antitoxin module